MSECKVVAREIVVEGSDKTKFMCELCKVTFCTRRNLNVHLRRLHQLQIEVPGNLICPLCEGRFRTMALLHEHVQNQHSITLKFVEKSFYSEEDFQDWKNKIEEEDRASYVCRNSTSKKGNGIIGTYYNCHRSGHCKLKQNNRVRNVKASGSIKTGSTCPAFIKVFTQTIDGISEITVKYQSVHLGHELETRTLRIRKKERENLAACLKLGIPMDKILDEVRQNYSPANRFSLLTRKHLHNIRRGFEVNNKKTEEAKAPQSTNVESSDSSIGYEVYDETEVSEHVEVQENEKNMAVSSLLLLRQQIRNSEEFNIRRRQTVNRLKELESRIVEWDPEYPFPELEDHIKAMNARLDIAACGKRNYDCLAKDPEPVPPKKPSPKRRKVTKKGSKKNQPNQILN